MTFHADYYMDNRSFVNLSGTRILDLGTVYMVHDCSVSGRLVTADPSHRPVPGIKVSSSSSSGSEFAEPNALTDSQGYWVNAPVLPVPSIVSFIPVQTYTRYIGNTTWVSCRPYQTLDLGTIHIEAGVVVQAELYDALQSHADGRPVPADVGQYAAGEATSTIHGKLFLQGLASVQSPQGTVARFFASPGPNNIAFMADGYLVNSTQITIPWNLAYTQVYDAGPVYLVEDAAYSIGVGLTWGWNASSAESAWGTGLVRFSACSLDGLSAGVVVATVRGINLSKSLCVDGGCQGGIGATQEGLAAPLRVRIEIDADMTGGCSATPTWPVPSSLPIIASNGISNWTFANLTSGEVTDVGEHDIQPGTYVQGQVFGVSNFTVIACSTDEPTACGAPTQATDARSIYFSYDPAGCTYGPTYFCVPIPFGPSKITVTSPSSPYSNFTTAYVKPADFNSGQPLSLGAVTPDRCLNLTLGTGPTVISGVVLDARTHQPIQNEIVAVSTGPADPGVPLTGTTGVVTGPNGNFSVGAPPGEDLVTIAAPLYESNWTWVTVKSGGADAGLINLTPLAFIAGRVIFPNGTGVPLARIQYCDINSPDGCHALGFDGLTSTFGSYFGEVTPGRIPLGTYRIVATADGTATNWTWVNATTPGGTAVADPIVLWPVGSGQLAWITGRLVDGSTGKGLYSGSWSVVATSTTGVTLSLNQLNSGGYYNASIAPGAWWFSASGGGLYYDGTGFLNVSSTAVTGVVPTIDLRPFPWLRGRVSIAPWASIGTGEGLGAEAGVRVCLKTGGLCGVYMTTDTGGWFNTTAPVGTYDPVTYSGIGTTTGTVLGGFDINHSSVNVTNASRPFLREDLTIFSWISGIVYDQSTNNNSPVRWGQMKVFSVPTDPSDPITNFGEGLNGGGEYTVFLPSTINASVEGTGGAGAFTSAWAYGTMVPEDSGAIAPSISVEHFGWLVFRVKDASGSGSGGGGGHGWVGGADVAIQRNNTSYSSSGTASAFGLTNVTAPPGPDLTVSVSAPEYDTITFYTHATESATTFYNATLTLQGAYPPAGNVTLVRWPWFSGTIVDPARHVLALQGVAISITNSSGAGNSGPPLSNGAGAWTSDAPLGTNLWFDFSATGYLPNSTVASGAPNQFTSVGTLNLTGYGVIAGRVVGYPGNHSISDALISVCRQDGSLCVVSPAQSNGSGIFWAIAPPGLDVLNVTALDSVPNGSVLVEVKPDSWNWVGSIVSTSYAFVFGTVRGLPSGALLPGANVSACFPNLFSGGSVVGGCVASVQTNGTGQFYLPVRADTYLLDANAPMFNDTYLGISLSPGEHVSVGTLLVQEYGFIAGSVIGSDTRSALSNASVEVCSAWTPITCAGPRLADPSGRFSLDAPPGRYLLTAVSPGYQQEDGLAVTFESGTTVLLPPISLSPMGTSQRYMVSGGVWLPGSNSTAAGAIVSAGTTYATATDSTGEFALLLPYGSYALTASLPGYSTARRSITVHAELRGIDLWLSLSTFLLSGEISDGLSGAALGNVSVSENGVTLAVSDSAGRYTTLLPNGTHTLAATPTGELTSLYVPLEFRALLQGAPDTFDLHLFPYSQRVTLFVADAVSLLPIANATVTGSGVTVEHVPVSFLISTSVTGTASVLLYNGSYSIRASAEGYDPAAGSVTEVSGRLTFLLHPSGPTNGVGAGVPSGQFVEYGLVGAAVASVVAGAILFRRDPPVRARLGQEPMLRGEDKEW